MKTLHRLGLAFGLALASAAMPAAELELQGNNLLVVGTLDGHMLPAFTDLVSDGRIRTVVFEDSLGGTAEVAEAYARVIRDKGLLTEARGQCYAACAYAFLAGRAHRFGRGGTAHALLIPLPRRPSAAELQAGFWQVDDLPRAPADGVVVATAAATPAGTEAPASTPAAVTAREAWKPGRGMVFTATPTLFGRVYNSYWCDGSQGTDFSRCERLPAADPHRLGVLTP